MARRSDLVGRAPPPGWRPARRRARRRGQILIEALGLRRRAAAHAQRQDLHGADMQAQGKGQHIAGLHRMVGLEDQRAGDPDLAGGGELGGQACGSCRSAHARAICRAAGCSLTQHPHRRNLRSRKAAKGRIRLLAAAGGPRRRRRLAPLARRLPVRGVEAQLAIFLDRAVAERRDHRRQSGRLALDGWRSASTGRKGP